MFGNIDVGLNPGRQGQRHEKQPTIRCTAFLTADCAVTCCEILFWSSPFTMAVTNPMRDIYSRLKPLGFDSGFVRELLLPDWWDDELARVPANRAIAEATISLT